MRALLLQPSFHPINNLLHGSVDVDHEVTFILTRWFQDRKLTVE
jgi:hypothetical protein